MAKDSLAERQKRYEKAYDQTIMRRIPVIIRVNGRSFSRITRYLDRPYCPVFMDIMANTMLAVIKKLDGTVFGYQQNDEITFIVRNDQSFDTEPFFGNRIQKITSIAAATTTLEFNKLLLQSNLNLQDDALFDCKAFGIPNITEAVNNLIWRQQDCTRSAITDAALVEIGAKYGKRTAFKMLHGKNVSERIEMLMDKCNIEFDSYYPSSYRNGIACYKAPKIIETSDGQMARQKWILDYDVQGFTQIKNVILNIINTGTDIFRAERDLIRDSDNTPKEN